MSQGMFVEDTGPTRYGSPTLRAILMLRMRLMRLKELQAEMATIGVQTQRVATCWIRVIGKKY